MGNQYKDSNGFTKYDWEMARDVGREMARRIRLEFPSSDIEVIENESQSRGDRYDCNLGKEDKADIFIRIDHVKIHFEQTGDYKWLEKDSRVFYFNEAALKKLLLKPKHGEFAIASYYLAKENPIKFYFKDANDIKENYRATKTKPTCRGPVQGPKYKIPPKEWCTFDQLVTKIRALLEKRK